MSIDSLCYSAVGALCTTIIFSKIIKRVRQFRQERKAIKTLWLSAELKYQRLVNKISIQLPSTCPDCKMESWNAHDAKNKYCGNCCKFF